MKAIRGTLPIPTRESGAGQFRQNLTDAALLATGALFHGQQYIIINRQRGAHASYASTSWLPRCKVGNHRKGAILGE